MTVLDGILPNNNDITIFYYTGHGFSYDKDDSRPYPQLDFRAYNNNASYNSIDFINKYTENLSVILQLMRMRGGRINIAMGDCCNTNIPYQRSKKSHTEMNVVAKVLPPVSNAMTRKMFMDEMHTISILVSSSSRGQFAIIDPARGSLFTYYFTQALAGNLSKDPHEDPYLPWGKLLTKSASQTLELSQQYDVGNGKPGYQEVIFDIMVEDERKL